MKDRKCFKVIAFMKNDSLGARAAAILVLLLLFLPDPVRVSGNWGMDVGRANPVDITSLTSDWNAFKMERNRINSSLVSSGAIERQKQLLGVTEGIDGPQLSEKLQTYWLMKVMTPLQRIALNPAASCAEAQFALSIMIGMKRQMQLFGIDESEQVSLIYTATEKMASLRCREEALDECVATGRFTQILDLMTGSDRQAQLLGRTDDLESWAVDALQQCAIYELHFVSGTKTKGGSAASFITYETVRDGRVPIQLEIPPGGIKTALGKPLGEILKGETKGGNNPFFVSIKCASSALLAGIAEPVCSPGADSSPINVRINEFDLKHREFYVDRINVFDRNVGFVESEITKQRLVGVDKFSFDFAGGLFSLQQLLKTKKPPSTVPLPPIDLGNTFYMAHKKDQIGGPRSAAVRIANITNLRPGVHPVILQFTYKDEGTFGDMTSSDSTDFELIHKPKPKPFPERSQDQIRKPLRPRPGV